MFFHIDDEKLLEKYKAIWTEDLKNIELNVLSVYDDRYIKTKIRTYGDNIECECESFKVISIDSLYENKYYLQVYLGNCTYKIAIKQMTDCLDDNLFED